MAQNKKVRFGPVALTNAAANLINPAGAGAGAVGYTATASYILINHIRIVNKTGVQHTYSLFIGATGGSAAGTEYGGSATPIAANGKEDIYPTNLRLDAVDFLTGLADANTSLTFEAEGEVGLA